MSSHAIQISLTYHETLGGHTIARHVGKTDAYLHQRLASEPSIPSASTFTDLATAEYAVNQTVQRNLAAFQAWRNSAAQMQSFDHDTGLVVGRVLSRAAPSAARSNPSPATKVRVIVRRRVNAAGSYLVLTAFPIV